MDPAYTDKKIVDLSDAELVALGFTGESVAPGVRLIIDKVRADPARLGTITYFMIDLLECRYPPKPKLKSTPTPAAPAPSQTDTGTPLPPESPPPPASRPPTPDDSPAPATLGKAKAGCKVL